MAISDWPLAERPRERLLAHGAAALSDAELLALFLRTGIRGKSAVELARDLLERLNGLGGLLTSPENLQDVKGLGPAKKAQLAAVIEVAKRCLHRNLQSGGALTSPGAVRDYLRLTISRGYTEVCVSVPRNSSSQESTRCWASSQRQTKTSCSLAEIASRR